MLPAQAMSKLEQSSSSKLSQVTLSQLLKSEEPQKADSDNKLKTMPANRKRKLDQVEVAPFDFNLRKRRITAPPAPLKPTKQTTMTQSLAQMRGKTSTVLQDSTKGGNDAQKEQMMKANELPAELKLAKRAKSCDGEF